MTSPRTLYRKLWDDHCIEDYGDGQGLLWVDRQLLYEATSFQALQGLEKRGLPVLRPKASLAVPDHIIPTHHRDPRMFSASTRMLLDAMFERCGKQGIDGGGPRGRGGEGGEGGGLSGHGLAGTGRVRGTPVVLHKEGGRVPPR